MYEPRTIYDHKLIVGRYRNYTAEPAAQVMMCYGANVSHVFDEVQLFQTSYTTA